MTALVDTLVDRDIERRARAALTEQRLGDARARMTRAAAYYAVERMLAHLGGPAPQIEAHPRTGGNQAHRWRVNLAADVSVEVVVGPDLMTSVFHVATCSSCRQEVPRNRPVRCEADLADHLSLPVDGTHTCS